MPCALYADPQFYDLLFPPAGERLRASERFYLEEARRARGPVLDLACGTGRLAIPLARAGLDVVGADASPSMLQAARAKAAAAGARARFLQADMRSFALPDRFAAILIAGNSLQHLLAENAVRECLAAARRHLAPGGRLIFDIAHWDAGLLARDPERRYPVLEAPGGGVVQERARYDAGAGLRRIRWDFPDGRAIDYILKVFFPEELRDLLQAAGFCALAHYGDFTREPFGEESARQVWIASS